MKYRNSEKNYGLVAIFLHWLVFLAFLSLFFLGLWMVDLDYYSVWYKTAPHIHKSIGILLFFTLSFRLIWRWINPKPRLDDSLSRIEKVSAHLVHQLLYLLLFALLISGYLISTADGRPIDVFNWFSVPATLWNLHDQAEISGLLHRYLAWGILALSSLHALAALKHHVIDKDDTLKKMLSTEEFK